MDTTHHTRTPRSPIDAGPGREAALRWLAQQLRWEHLLADLRGETRKGEDRPQAA